MCSTSTLFTLLSVYYSIVRRKNIVGLRIRKARKESQLTQMKLAAQLQLLGLRIDRTSIAKIESGRRPVFDIEIIAIAKVLNVSIPSLFKDSEEPFNQLDTK